MKFVRIDLIYAGSTPIKYIASCMFAKSDLPSSFALTDGAGTSNVREATISYNGDNLIVSNIPNGYRIDVLEFL